MDRINGILAISQQPQYLEDVRRWVEILDREGQNNERRLFVYTVQNGRSRDLARTLNTAFGNGGAGDASPNAVPVAPGFDDANRPQAPVAVVSRGSTSASVPVGSPLDRPAPGSTAAAAVAAAGSDAETVAATITSDENTNSIIVFGTPRQYAVVEDALRRLDILPYQVLIEAAITEVSLTDSLRFGVQWNFQTGTSNFSLNGRDRPERRRNNFPASRISLVAPTFRRRSTPWRSEPTSRSSRRPSCSFSTIRRRRSRSATKSRFRLSRRSAPRFRARRSSTQSNIVTTGVILKVTPRVNGSGLVLLDMAQEVSDVSQNSTSSIQSPIISTRRISTSIAVQDGQVIALGGLFRDSKSFGKNGIPILSRIPILGALFGTHQDLRNRTELLVILKARVLRTIDDGRAVTEELRAKLRTLEPFKTQGKIP